MIDHHPDANQLAALAERRLLPGERQEVLEHLAHCTDCRETLALAVRASAQPSSARPFRMGWRFASAVAALALVLTAAWGVRLALRTPEKQIVAARPPAPRPVAPSLDAPQIAEPVPETAARKLPRKTAPAKQVTAPALRQKTSETAPSAGFASGENKAQEVNSSVGKSTDRLLEAPAPLGLGAASAGFTPRMAWQIHSGAVEHSPDSGRSWQPVPVANGVNFRAIAADGTDVWAGGSNGMLFHSLDGGSQWQRVAVAEGMQNLTGAIVAIRLPQVSEIVLETDSGEQWISRDGGIVWRRL